MHPQPPPPHANNHESKATIDTRQYIKITFEKNHRDCKVSMSTADLSFQSRHLFLICFNGNTALRISPKSASKSLTIISNPPSPQKATLSTCWGLIKRKSYSHKVDFILVLWLVLDDDDGAWGHPSPTLGGGGGRHCRRQGVGRALPGCRPFNTQPRRLTRGRRGVTMTH